jgi:sugar transferase (PEP-CTERM/EpsH1 system associated)
MAKILFLAHRVPFPPNKGDKIRAFHILEHLRGRHQVWLGASADDPQDMAHLAAARQCHAGVHFGLVGGVRRAFNMALAGFTGAPLSVARFRQRKLAHWIDGILREVKPDLVYVYSSALAQYVIGRLPAGTGLIVDFVDADAEKWRAYAVKAPPPMRWIYAREFDRIVRYEAKLLGAADAGVLVSETERMLQAEYVHEDASRLHVISNGVDAEYFMPVEPADRPARAGIVFTGTMDYLPNIQAVCWFAHEVLPLVHRAFPNAVFRIVGAKPTAEVRALASLPGVEVTGVVSDVRPYLSDAAVVVAPLRIARGIQNKVLEAMAAARPVVATPEALDGVDAKIGRDILVAEGREAFAHAVIAVLGGHAPADLGQRARAYVLSRHQWGDKLVSLDALIAGVLHRRSSQPAA